MNRKAIVYFTYGPDFDCLVESVRSLRRVPGCRRTPIYVFDDGNYPMTPEQVQKLPEGIHYERTYFNRNKNLNGIECVIGMLICFERVKRETGAKLIFKIDCDSIIHSLKYWVNAIKKEGYDMAGMCVNPDYLYCAGPCYVMRSEIIYDLLVNISKLLESEISKIMPHLPEDHSITELARMLDKKVKVLDNSPNNNPVNWILAPFVYNELEFSKNDTENTIAVAYNAFNRYRFYQNVNFGNRYEISDELREFFDKRCSASSNNSIAGFVMKMYNDFIENNENPIYNL